MNPIFCEYTHISAWRTLVFIANVWKLNFIIFSCDTVNYWMTRLWLRLTQTYFSVKKVAVSGSCRMVWVGCIRWHNGVLRLPTCWHCQACWYCKLFVHFILYLQSQIFWHRHFSHYFNQVSSSLIETTNGHLAIVPVDRFQVKAYRSSRLFPVIAIWTTLGWNTFSWLAQLYLTRIAVVLT